MYTFYRGQHMLDHLGDNNDHWHITRNSRLARLFYRLEGMWHYKWRYSPFPIYWERYSRDCDQYAVEWCERHPTGWAAYSSYCDAMDNAEGPERFYRISKADYLRNKDHHSERDHAAEQMNY